VAELAQFAALPYVQLSDGLRICLITSRGTRRWVIPKGWPKAELRPHELAAREAEEEAGLIGEIASDPIGSYTYRKRLHFLASVTCRVSVFPLLVNAQEVTWPERAERDVAWTPVSEAARMVREPDLRRLLAALPLWIDGQRSR
jgi:8-oxo-dGTP pyrophosphatase MutT (NUDIX family)